MHPHIRFLQDDVRVELSRFAPVPEEKIVDYLIEQWHHASTGDDADELARTRASWRIWSALGLVMFGQIAWLGPAIDTMAAWPGSANGVCRMLVSGLPRVAPIPFEMSSVLHKRFAKDCLRLQSWYQSVSNDLVWDEEHGVGVRSRSDATKIEWA